MAIVKSAERPCPARERAGYAHEGRLRGLPEPASAGLLWRARPFTGRAWAFGGLYNRHALARHASDSLPLP